MFVHIIVLFLLLLCSTPVLAENPANFEDWLSGFKEEALSTGITLETLEQAFADISEPDASVIALDTKQPEKTRLFSDYVKGVVTEKRVAKARKKWQENRTLLKKVAARYGVPAPVLLSLWAVESNFGENQGRFSVIRSLATLAYDGRRREFFEKELVNALKIIQSETISPEEMTGSWAGAMGQTQFMPSSFLKFAVDFNHDGKKDIWQSNADALASIANYLHSKGWNRKTGWGIQVTLPDSRDTAEWRAMKEAKPLKLWRKMGFMTIRGNKIPNTSLSARLVVPEGEDNEAFLVFPNYDVIMDWNHSIYFATSVGLLADAVERK